jgi:GNAT superfamily N-acetyltransferase
MEAADVQAIAQDLRPFKRGIDGLVQQLRARPGQVVAVGALDAAQLTGLALATQQAQGQWLVHDVFVFPDARRRGIGRSLIHALGARLRQIQGAELALVMTAEILPYNRASQAIFRQCGWRQVGVVSRQRPGQGPTL